MDKRVADLCASINKEFGFNTARPAVELEESLYRIPTGSISLDVGLGGGVPIGRMVTITGWYSSAKSVLAYYNISNFQKCKKKKVLWEKYSTKEKPVYRWVISPDGDTPMICALIQSESHSYANDWAAAIGVDIENLIIVYPSTMEEALDVAIELQKKGVDLIVHDSYDAYTPNKVVVAESTGENQQMGIKQILFGKYNGIFQGLNNKADREGRIPCTVIALCQLREKIGVLYGSPEKTSGGNSNRHTDAIEIRLRKSDMLSVGTGDSKEHIGQTVKWKVEKNKTFKPYQTGEFNFYFSEGGVVPAGKIDNARELIIEAMMYDIIQQKGAWFYYNNRQLAQGKDAAIEVIRKDAKLFAEIKDKVMKRAFTVSDEEFQRPDMFGDEVEEIEAPKEEKKIIKKGKK